MRANLKSSDTLAVDPEDATLWTKDNGLVVNALIVPLFNQPIDESPTKVTVDMRTGAIVFDYDESEAPILPPGEVA